MGLSWWWLSGRESACQCRRCGFHLWPGKIPWRRKWPGYSLEGLFLKLKLQYFVHLMRRADFLKKTLMLGKTEGKRRSGWQRMRWLDSITDLMDIKLSKLYEIVEEGEPGVLQSMGSQRVTHDLANEQQLLTDDNTIYWMGRTGDGKQEQGLRRKIKNCILDMLSWKCHINS